MAADNVLQGFALLASEQKQIDAHGRLLVFIFAMHNQIGQPENTAAPRFGVADVAPCEKLHAAVAHDDAFLRASYLAALLHQTHQNGAR